MRVVVLVPELGRSGGMSVVWDLARHLQEQGDIDCELLVCAPDDLPVSEAHGVPVRRLEDAGTADVDVAIATWWTTTERLWDLRAGHRAILLQSVDHRYYRDEETPDRLGAEAVLDLPVHWLVVSESLRRLVAAVRPDARSWLVPPGIDKSIFRPPSRGRREGPLRVLVEGQPSMWFKGVHEAVAAVRSTTVPMAVTVVAADPAHAGNTGADRVLGGLEPAEMASLYAEHDVMLKLSRFEGLSLPVLEALHVGTPCIVTPFGGAADLIEHGSNGLVVGFDDAPGTVAALERLAGDEALRDRLRVGALATASNWADRGEALANFTSAVRELAESEPPDDDVALRRLALGRRRGTELLREHFQRHAIEREHAEQALTGARAEAANWQAAWREADARVAEYDRWARDLQSRIENLQRRPGFRIEERLRRLVHRTGGGK
jgi:hypothetical protein